MSPEEYEQRRKFVELMKTMKKPEFIEIARILRRHNVSFSENRSGIFFDMTTLNDEVFQKLLELHEFIQTNDKELDKRFSESVASQ